MDDKPPDRADFDARLRALNERRAAERAAETRSRDRADSGWGVALKLSSEFVAAIIVGAALGYGLDAVAGTGPWGLIVLTGFGFAAAVLNVLRGIGHIAPSRIEQAKIEQAKIERGKIDQAKIERARTGAAGKGGHG